jgi:hypothetical protein
MRLEVLDKLKIFTSSETQTGDVLARSIVPQPTPLPRTPLILQNKVLYPLSTSLNSVVLSPLANYTDRAIASANFSG